MARVSPYPSTEPPAETSLLNFPEKLWWIVNNPKREEIHWTSEGTSIVIPNTRKFVDEILNSPSSALFKTKNFSSFVRQLNLYGFRKVTEYPKKTVHSPLLVPSKCEFKHTFFRKGRRGKMNVLFWFLFVCLFNLFCFVLLKLFMSVFFIVLFFCFCFVLFFCLLHCLFPRSLIRKSKSFSGIRRNVVGLKCTPELKLKTKLSVLNYILLNSLV